MKKPEPFREKYYEEDRYEEGYNQAWEDMEAYYEQHIKENYIRKDKLPSQEELEEIIRN